jgi:hypothetical protein
MSHAGLILGLPELEVERVDRNDAIAVYAKPRKRPCCLHCDYPKIRIKATYQRTLKHTRQGNQLITLLPQGTEVPLPALWSLLPPSLQGCTAPLPRLGGLPP